MFDWRDLDSGRFGPARGGAMGNAAGQRHMRCLGRAAAAFAISSALFVLQLGPTAAADSPAHPPARSGPSTQRLSVMEFNIENGGLVVDFRSIVSAIEAAGPDVVGVEEAQGNIPQLARALRFPYYSVRLQILSRFPLVDPPGSKGLYVLIELGLGQVAAIGNVHLPSNPYSPNLIRRGAKRKDIIALESRVRLPFVEPTVRALSKLVSDGIPSFLTGEFNAPSFRDWTKATVGFSYRRYPVHWPVSEYVER